MTCSSWQPSVTKRYSHSIGASGHYTWSKSLAAQGGDNGACYQGDAATKNQDFFNFATYRGPSAGEATQYFSSQWRYELPQITNFGLLRYTLGGWQVSGIGTAQTGGAFTVTQSSSLPANRPDYIGNGAIRGPGQWNVEFSLGKNFALREGMQLQVRTDMVTPLNHTNLSGLVVEITNTRFG